MIELNLLNNLSQLKDYDIHVFDPIIFDDVRGNLTVRAEDKLPDDFPFSNHFSYKSTASHKNVARGLHWQKNTAPIIKYIDLKKGSLYTILLDTRTNKGVIFNWTSEMGKIIKVSQYYAHGFYCIQDAEFSYICKGKYSTQDETTFNVFPSVCRIMGLDTPLISEKDSVFPELPVKII